MSHAPRPPETLPPELERRIASLEAESGERIGLTRGCWMWLLALGIVVPALLLVWGWPQ